MTLHAAEHGLADGIRTARPSTGRNTPSTHFTRAVFAAMRGDATRGGSERTLRALYPDDRRALLILRAAVSPASLGDADWAGLTAMNAVSDFLTTLGPAVAGSALLRAGLSVDLAGHAGILIPSVVSTAGGAAFVGEGDVIAVRNLATGGPLLKPAKLAVIVVLTREVVEHTSGEGVVRAVMVENSALALDSALLSANAGDDVTPAGLRFNATSITASPDGGDGAMMRDLGSLVEVVSAIGGDRLIFVAAPGEAAKVKLRAPQFAYPFFGSSALPSGSVMCIAANAVVSATSPISTFSSSFEATLHMSDMPLSIGGAGPIVASPSRSVFQTDTVAVKVTMGVSWGLRAPADDCVAFANDVTW